MPYFNAESQYATSDLAKQINQAKATQKAGFAGYGGALPSGFAASAERDLAGRGAEVFDSNQLSLLREQQQSKLNAALALAGQGQGAASTAVGANQSIMQAPLQNNFWGNLVQGIVGGASKVGAAYLG